MRNEALDKMLSAYLDGELTQQEEQRVRLYLEDCEEAREEFRELQGVKDLTSSLSFAPPPDDRLDELAKSLSVAAPRKAGWILLSAGVVAIIVVMTVQLISIPHVPWWVKAFYGMVGVGFVLLLASVIRQRALEAPFDRYRGVKR